MTTGISVAAPVEVWVAPDGNDGGLGTREAPFASLAGARDRVWKIKAEGELPVGGATVWVRGGEYFLEETFVLEERDGGSEEAPVVYRAWEEEEVRLSGGRRIPEEVFRSVEGDTAVARVDAEVRPHVRVVDLGGLGVVGVGEVPDTYRGAAGLAELFFEDERMTLARWPNEGWAEVDEIVEQGSVPRQGETDGRPGSFGYAGERPERWVGREVWLHGYWCFDWYDEAIRVAEIDPVEKVVSFSAPHHYGVRNGNPPPRRWYATNVLEELDRPGEYYLDRQAGKLYFWPPGELEGARVVLSMLEEPILKLDGVSHLTLRGFIVENGRGTGVAVEGGTGVEVLACAVRNVGGTGISVAGGEGHRVEACDIHDTGTLGLVLKGGDRRTLMPGGHRAVNNHIYRFARLQRTYASGIQVNGVGNLLAHNLLHDSPHQAIGLGGNDHVVEYNVVHHVTMETDDCGAFYKGRNPSCRGNVVRFNFWHHIGREGGHGNNAVYFDDGDGGDVVFGNVFFRAGEPAKGNMGTVFSHGGHDLLIENNIFVECKRAIGASPWDDERWKGMIEGELWQERLLREVDITSSLYLEKYPRLEGFMSPQGEPRMSAATRNVAVMCGEFFYGNFEDRENLVMDQDPGFVDMEKGNFALREDAAIFRKAPGFEPIPFGEMGLFVDELRPTLPEEGWEYEPPKQLPPPRLPRVWRSRGMPRPKGEVPVFAVPKIDGDAKGGRTGAIMKLEADYRGFPAGPVSTAWLGLAEGELKIFVENEVDPETPVEGHQWGTSDAIEVALRRAGDGKKGPIWVLRGFMDGHLFVGKTTAGNREPKSVPEETGVTFAADRVEDGVWTGEWRIPLAAFGFGGDVPPRLAFCLTVRKRWSDLWLMWEATGGNSFDVERGGVLEFGGGD